MRGEDLLEAMALVDPAYIAAADEAPSVGKHRWRKWAGAAACLCLLAAGALGFWYAESREILPVGDAASEDGAAADGCDSLPSDIRPALLVDGTLFYWTGPAMAIVGADIPGAMVSTIATGDTCLPEGYKPYGEIISVTTDPAAKDGELTAGFSASGTIYTSEATPEAVYVRMTTDWFTHHYIRFVSAQLDGSRLRWQGRDYRIGQSAWNSPALLWLEELPEGYAAVGQLHYVGRDILPEEDLETNGTSDGYGYSLEGREVYVNPDDPEYVYVLAPRYWRGGQTDGYWQCPLWAAERE